MQVIFPLKEKKDTGEIKKLVSDVEILKEKVIDLKDKMYTAWHKEHKAFGWERSDIRLSGVIGRCDTVKRKLTEFLNDTSIVIEELETERLMFGPTSVKPGKSLVPAIRYPLIASAAVTIR